MSKIDWSKDNILWIANETPHGYESLDPKGLRGSIEPWLTAVFQSEHLSLLLGTGITTAIVKKTGTEPQAMQRVDFTTCKERISQYASDKAKDMNRGDANFEDDLRTAIELYKGLEILGDKRITKLKEEINEYFRTLIINLLANESTVQDKLNAISYLKWFIISFASRTATRDRLHIFTTNYDRFIEYALDAAGIYTLDRFVGKLRPLLRMHKIELDYHYNPPGIRGEPRYVEGVVRYTKLHGSVDWKFCDGEIIRESLPFGQKLEHSQIQDPFATKVIYPNSAKGIDTVYFPYSELFRDFSAACCRPNSALVTYGYGFGDSHINNIIFDMLKIPSAHLVIISYDKCSDRIKKFVEKSNPAQLTLLIGNHFGDLTTLVENYLPKSAIDRISDRKQKIEDKRNSESTSVI